MRSPCVVFSPDGERLASLGKDGAVQLYDVASKKELAILRPPEARLEHFVFSPDSKRLASAGQDGIVRLWDATSGKEVTLLSGNEKVINSVAFSPNGTRLASAGWDGTVRLWISRETPEEGEKRRKFWLDQHTGSK